MAPLINFTLAAAVLEKAACILKIKTALESPCPSKIKFPVSVATALVLYTPGTNVSPLPKSGATKKLGIAAFN